jgi:hypothetical protein
MLGDAEDLRDAFHDSLNCAIAHGLRPQRSVGLGDETCTAIEAIAEEHPDASVDQIACAFDAFAREHGTADIRTVSGEPITAAEPPKRFVVQRRFKRS